MFPSRFFSLSFTLLVVVGMLLSACAQANPPAMNENLPGGLDEPSVSNPQVTPLPTRPVYAPGELVDYIAQTGDTLPAIASHFNTTVKEILEANPIIPKDATTMPPGLPMKIPIYYRPFWGSPYQILPDSLFVNGPAQLDFNAVEFVDSQPGWFKHYSFFLGNATRRGGELINYIADQFSISPRLLLAILEYLSGGLSQPEIPENVDRFLLYRTDNEHRALALQLVQLANTLNNGYYGWRSGALTEFSRSDSSLERPDPWQNAASVALQYTFSQFMDNQRYYQAIHAEGLQKTYEHLFGNPWEGTSDHIPGSLTQPQFLLPFPAGKTWAYTGGPHTGWGSGAPFAAVDFAPLGSIAGCGISSEFATAIADGVVTRTGPGYLTLDLDGDGDDRTGWVVFYLHLSSTEMVKTGTVVKAGDPLGHPSCEGGNATGSHVHIARKYNGEWIAADSALPFNMEGWVPINGSVPYEGKLTRYGRTVIACVCANQSSLVTAGQP